MTNVGFAKVLEQILGNLVEPACNADDYYRSVRPSETIRRAKEIFRAAGITRLANITGLDVVGMPVWQAIRPLSRNMTVSQGKGVSHEAAQASAIMESIEMWHAERPRVCFSASMKQLQGKLPYDLVTLLPGMNDNALLDWPIAWVDAYRLDDLSATFLPLHTVMLDFTEEYVGVDGFPASSTGLASGNTYAEAILHAVLECIERNIVPDPCDNLPNGIPVPIDSPDLASLSQYLERASDAGLRCSVEEFEAIAGTSVFRAAVRSRESLVFCGAGCHLSPKIAKIRAITEAFQSRLTMIAGARDDISDEAYNKVNNGMINVAETGNYNSRDLHKLRSVIKRSIPTGDVAKDLRNLATELRNSGYFALVTDLSKIEIGIPVVFVRLFRDIQT